MRNLIPLLTFAIASLGSQRASTAAIQLQLNLDEFAQTWTVSAIELPNSNDNRGIASFAIDVIGLGGFTVTRAYPLSQTNQSPNPPFSFLRLWGQKAEAVFWVSQHPRICKMQLRLKMMVI